MTKCQNQRCGKDLGPLPSTAPHKRFCSAKCRMEWHSARRAAVSELLTAIHESDGELEHDLNSVTKRATALGVGWSVYNYGPQGGGAGAHIHVSDGDCYGSTRPTPEEALAVLCDKVEKENLLCTTKASTPES